jgi:hypothetical protein
MGLVLRGCAAALLLLLGLCGILFWRLAELHRRATAAHERIRPGMTLRQVYAASGEWWSSYSAECASADLASFRVTETGGEGTGVLVLNPGASVSSSTAYRTRGELLRLIDKTPSLLECREVDFTFRIPGAPPRTSFSVFFEGGKVTRVSEPRTWD